jgi:hypothetical protein
MEIWIEVRSTKLVQLWVLEVFEPVTLLLTMFVERTLYEGHSQQDSTTLTPDALRRPQVFGCEIPHGVTDV